MGETDKDIVEAEGERGRVMCQTRINNFFDQLLAERSEKSKKKSGKKVKNG